MKKESENLFGVSKEIIEIPIAYENEAKELVNNLWLNNSSVLIEIDCRPNGHLNPFQFDNGTKSAKIILELGGSFLGEERALLEQKITQANQNSFVPNYSRGEYLGLWKRVKENDYRELINWDEPFCVKNEKGITKIWHPDLRRYQKSGAATRSSIVRFIREERTYLQKLFAPLPAINFSSWGMSYRLVFFCQKNQEPEFIGGLWISRPGLKIYPDKNAVVGLISTQVL